MADGRTIWYSEDASYVHRALVVELGEELGPAVLAIMFALRGEAKQQKDEGKVLTGFATLNRNACVKDRALTKRVIERAAAIGILDDLEVLDDGARFRCRVSGWKADQEKAATAERVRRHRASNGLQRSVTVGNEDRTGQDRDNDSLRSSSRRDTEDDHQPDEQPTAENAPLCHLLADLIVANGSPRPRIGKKWTTAERLLLERDKRPLAEAERLVRWSQAHDFWRSVILSMVKFRSSYDEMRLQEQRKRGNAAEGPRGESPSDLLRAIREKGEPCVELG